MLQKVPKKLNPYIYVSSLSTEDDDDKMINAIDQLCSAYIDDSLEDSEYNAEDLDIALEFCETKLRYVDNISESFKVINNYNPFTQLGHTLDLVTIYTELDDFDYKTIYYEMNSQITTLKISLKMYLKILKRISTDYIMRES